jgi:hypothetical protein
MGRLPLKGAQDFERFCRENPDTVTQLGLPERIDAAQRLLDVAGEPEPWSQRLLAQWRRPAVVIGITALAAVLLVVTLMLAGSVREKSGRIEAQQRDLQQQPLSPVKGTRSIVIEPSRQGPLVRSAVSIGSGNNVELADLKFNMLWSTYQEFRVTIDRVGQGRLAQFGNMARDSNGHLRIALNSSALGPGDYAVTIEGLDKWGKPVPQAWTRFNSVR